MAFRKIPVASAGVVEQNGERVVVSVTMRGFPPGFQLRRGDKIVISLEESEAVVSSLVRVKVISNGAGAKDVPLEIKSASVFIEADVRGGSAQ